MLLSRNTNVSSHWAVCTHETDIVYSSICTFMPLNINICKARKFCYFFCFVFFLFFQLMLKPSALMVYWHLRRLGLWIALLVKQLHLTSIMKISQDKNKLVFYLATANTSSPFSLTIFQICGYLIILRPSLLSPTGFETSSERYYRRPTYTYRPIDHGASFPQESSLHIIIIYCKREL